MKSKCNFDFKFKNPPRVLLRRIDAADAAALRARADAARRDAQRWAAVAEALWDAAPMDDAS